jgi:hypothetical protein
MMRAIRWERNMRKPLADLINREDPAWPIIARAVAASRGRARILPTTRELGERGLLALQFTTRSILGAIVYETGGLVVDHGWLRLLGAGGREMVANLASANGLDHHRALAHDAVGIVVAVDVLGGVFAINSGRLHGARDNVFYLAPDTLEWRDLKVRYSGFVEWALSGDMSELYRSLRWSNWRKDVEALALDEGLQVRPPLSSEHDKKLPVVREPVYLDELWRHTIELSRQLHARRVRAGEKVPLQLVK